MSTPFQRLTDLDPNVKHFRVFGCAAFVLLTSRFDKLSAIPLLVTFIGYDIESKAYRVYNAVNKKIYISTNVRFNESVFGRAARYDLELVDDLDILLPQNRKHQSRTCSVSTKIALPTDDTPHSFSKTTSTKVISTSIQESSLSDLETTPTPIPFILFASPYPPPQGEPTVEIEWFQDSTPIVNSANRSTSPTSNTIVGDVSNSRTITPRSMRTPAYWKDYVSYSAKKSGNTLNCYEVEIIDYMGEQLIFDKAIKIPKWHASMVDELNSIH